MRFAAIAGPIHSFLPMAQRQMNVNDTQPLAHPVIDRLGMTEGLTRARRAAAMCARPTPTPVNAVYVGGRWFERSAA